MYNQNTYTIKSVSFSQTENLKLSCKVQNKTI